MKKALLLVIPLLVLLLAGCTMPSQPNANVSNGNATLMAGGTCSASEGASLGSVDNASVAHITQLIEQLSSMQGQPLQLNSYTTEMVKMVKVAYNVNGQVVNVYVTPDYKKIVMGREMDVGQLEQAIEQSMKPKDLSKAITIPDAAHVEGESSAPITIIEFADYQCPYCAIFHIQTYESLKSKYIDTGKVRYVFWDFPLSFHQMAKPASVAANCAGEQNKYWEMHNAIYNAEGKDRKQLSNDLLKDLAKNMSGLNYNEWETCFNASNTTVLDQLAQEAQQQYAVSGTPTFLIYSNKKLSDDGIKALIKKVAPYRGVVVKDPNGTVGVEVSGALPINVFDTIIAELS